MSHSIRTSYSHTIAASYLGCVTQAVVNNFAPLLFLTFQTQMGLSLEEITLLTTVNFSVQLLVDFLSVKAADRIGYRVCIVAAHLFSAAGLAALAILPGLIQNAYAGLIAAVTLYAIGGGLIEVLVSPIVEACPTEKKEAAMSLLHSFYCWGHVAVVLLSSAFFQLAGIGNWRVMACVWALLPLGNAVYFALVPIRPVVEERRRMPVRSLFGQKLFWLFLLMMLCAGASEQGMSQWASAFAQSGLGVSKAMGDLAGPCAFAVLMGTSTGAVWQIQRPDALARGDDGQRRAVHRMLRDGGHERKRSAGAGRMRAVRLFGRHQRLRPRDLQHRGARASRRRNGDVCAVGVGGGSGLHHGTYRGSNWQARQAVVGE